VHDRFHIVLNRIDEAGRALWLWLHSHVEPHRRIEGHSLFDEQVGQLAAESITRCRIGEISALLTPIDDGVHDAADELAYGAFAFRRVELAVKIFRRDDV